MSKGGALPKGFTEQKQILKEIPKPKTKKVEKTEYIKKSWWQKKLEEAVPKPKLELLKEKEGKGDWGGWYDFLGLEDPKIKEKEQKKRVDKVLESLRSNWELYLMWPDGLLRVWFEAEGCFAERDPYKRSYFTNFFNLREKPEGRKALLFWLRTLQFDKPFGGFSLTGEGVVINPEGTKVESRSYTEDKAKLIEEDDIDSGKLIKQIRKVDYDKTDPTVFDFHVIFTVILFWKSAMNAEIEGKKVKNKEVQKVIREKQNGNKFHDTVRRTFLNEYKEVKKIKMPKLNINPTLMQLYNAWKMTKVDGFFNMSRTGVGKSLAGILSTIITKSKYTLVICSNAIIDQWKDQILQVLPDAEISKGKTPHEYINGKPNYHIINYNKFSIKDVNTTIKKLKNQAFDFIILDETQNLKIRDELKISQRRKSVENLLTKLSILNKIKILCLSATPVINNVKEGKSMIQLLAHNDKKVLDALTKFSDSNTIRSASKVFALFLPYCIRFMEKYDIKEIGKLANGSYKTIDVDSYFPEGTSINDVEKMTWLNFEQVALQGKLPEIIKRIKGKTVIYTEYVTGMVNKLQKSINEAGYSTAIFTGSDKSGKDPFLANNADVLICSSALSEGFDGLQKVAGTIIFASLPWTYAKFEQVIGRLVRKGRKKNKKGKNTSVSIHIILARLKEFNGKKAYEYDRKIKYERLLAKNQTARCVTDGRLPDKIQLPKAPKLRKAIIEMMVKTGHSLILTRSEARKFKPRKTRAEY